MKIRPSRLLVLVSSLALGACGVPRTEQAETGVEFDIGGANDPVMQMAKGGAAASGAQVSVTNGTGETFKGGLITFSPLFAEGGAASAALADYVHENGDFTGDAEELATALGLILGSDAFVLKQVKEGDTEATVVDVPTGAQVYYLARVHKSSADFVAAGPVAIEDINGDPMIGQVDLYGFSIDGGGDVQPGAASVGGRLPTSPMVAGNLTECKKSDQQVVPSTLFSDTFAQGSLDPDWPANTGYAGDFAGDWYTDGTTARYYNPNWGGADPGAPIPAMTGFARFINVCPEDNSMVSMTANVVTDFTAAASDTTLVIYYFDKDSELISYDAGFPVGGASPVELSLLKKVIPPLTRRIAVVVFAYIDVSEMGTVYYDTLDVDYEPSGVYSTTAVATDDFSNYGPSDFGDNQPTGWSEFGGDWYSLASFDHATLWNPAWGGDQSQAPPVDTGMTKTFSLPAASVAGDLITGSVFAASTFTDPTSFVRLRLAFDAETEPSQDSTRYTGSTYGFLDIRRVEPPVGTTTVTAVINVYLGLDETSSVYVDDFSLILEQ